VLYATDTASSEHIQKSVSGQPALEANAAQPLVQERQETASTSAREEEDQEEKIKCQLLERALKFVVCELVILNMPLFV
jgi:hypothetical protein